jgi:hypothetical protein
MTQMWSFELPDGRTIITTLDWAYVPYLEELRMWVLNDWDLDLEDKENWCRFYEAADYYVQTRTKPKHPIDWVLDKVGEHLNEPD